MATRKRPTLQMQMDAFAGHANERLDSLNERLREMKDQMNQPMEAACNTVAYAAPRFEVIYGQEYSGVFDNETKEFVVRFSAKLFPRMVFDLHRQAHILEATFT